MSPGPISAPPLRRSTGIRVKPFYDDLSEDSRDPVNQAIDLLMKLQLVVTGRFSDGAVPVFSKSNRQIAVICDLKQLSYSDLLSICTPTARRDFGAGGPRSSAAKSRYMRKVRDAIKLVADGFGAVKFYGRPSRPNRAAGAERRRNAAA